MNISRLRLLPVVTCVILGICTLLRVMKVQRSQYPIAPTAESLLPTNTPSSRPVSPLFNPDHAEELLEGKQRDKWQLPQQLTARLRLQPGEIVADIGAGSGYLMPYLSKAVGTRGGVFAEEIQAAYLPILRQKAQSCHNVHVVLGRADDPKLPGSSVDCFVLLTVYHEVEHPVTFLRTLRRSASPNARLAIIDFDAAIKGSPPAPEGHWIGEQDVLREAKEAGWELSERHDLLRTASQFYLIFRPHKQ